MIIRVRFGKEGALRFIGHLDVLRTFQKIFRRAQIPMAYSQGFSPHPIMSFALPLGLGLTSEGEYLDAELPDDVAETVPLKELLPRLRAASSEELPVLAVRILPEKAGNAMASVGRASYRLEIPEALAAPVAAAAEKLLAENSHVIDRKTKTQTVSFDLRPCIYELSLCCRQGGGDSSQSLSLTLSAGSRSNVKPELVWEELSRMAALPDGARPLSIRRLDLLTEDGISLGAVGEAPESFCAERDNV